MLALAVVAFFASSPGQSFLTAVFVDDLIADTGVSRTWFSGLYAAGSIVSAVVMLGLGRMIAARGLRAAWLVVALVLALACAAASLATGAVLLFVALALLRTSGQGAFPLLGTLLVARGFDRRRGQAMAVANLGSTLASVALPPLVALMIVGLGWRESYRLLGLVLIVLVAPLAWLVARDPSSSRVDRQDEEEGEDAEGAEDAEDPERPEPVGEGEGYPAAIRPTRRGRPDLPSATAARLLLILAAPPVVGTAITFHATSILAARGIGFVAAGGALGLLGATAAIGVVLAGLGVDRVSTRTTLVVVAVLELVAVGVLLVPVPVAAYAAFAVLGVAMGGFAVVNGTVWARTFGTSQLHRIQSTALSSTIAAAAIAPLVPALSLAVTGSYQPGLVLLALLTAGSLGLAWTLPRVRGLED